MWCGLNFNEILDLVDQSVLRFIDGTEEVSNFSSFWIAMEPSQLRWLKKVFCFLFMKKVGFRKLSERFFGGILFCRFDSWPSISPAFVFFIVVTYKPLAWTQNRFSGGKKQYQTTFKLQCMFIFKFFTIWLIFYDRRQKLEFLIQSLTNVVTNFATHTELGLPVDRLIDWLIEHLNLASAKCTTKQV